MKELAILVWVVILALVVRVVAQGGWSGLLSWLGAKFGPVDASSGSGNSGGGGGNQTPKPRPGPGPGPQVTYAAGVESA